jgi:hypothetical protein
MWGRGIEEVGEDERDSLESCVGYGELSLENDGRNGKRCIYLVCDFSGQWLKDSSLLCCIVIILNVEGTIGYVM